MYRPPGFHKILDEEVRKIPVGDAVVALVLFVNAGADAMLKALEPIIRDIAPSSSLVDLFYGGNDESKA